MTSAPTQHEAPPVGEELHLPGPSLVPILNAVGITLFLVGLTTIGALMYIGGALFLWTTVKWVLDTRREIDALPADHSAH